MSIRNLQITLVLIPLIFICFGNLHAQQTKEQSKEVPKELKEQMELYWKYWQKEDWGNLFEISDTSILNKQDYIEMKKKEKTNPYRRFNSILEIALENKMLFYTSSSKWEISGCTKINARDDKEKWIESATFASQDENNQWVDLGGTAFSVQADGGLKPCEKNVPLLPIRIKVSELKKV